MIREIFKSKIKKNINEMYIEVKKNWLKEDGVRNLYKCIHEMNFYEKYRVGSEKQYDAYFIKK